MTKARNIADATKTLDLLDATKASNSYVNVTYSTKTLSNSLLSELNAVKASNTYVNSLVLTSGYKTGDIVKSTVNKSSGWLPCDGSTYLKASYPDLYNFIGSIPNGSWSSTSTPLSGNVYAVTYGNGLYLVGGTSGGCATSPDTITWTNRTYVAGFTSGTINTAAYGNGLLLIGGTSSSGVARISSSSDGATWTSRTTHSATGASFKDIIYANGLFVAVGHPGIIYTSSDGITWTSRVSNTTQSLLSISYGNGLFVAVGSTGTIVTSPNGIDWTVRSSPITNLLFDVTFGNGLFVAVSNTDRQMITSIDGINWLVNNSLFLTGKALNSITYYKGSFYAGGSDAIIFTSQDGIRWTPYTPETTATNSIQTITVCNERIFFLNSATTNVWYMNPFSYDYATEFITPNYQQFAVLNHIKTYIKT